MRGLTIKETARELNTSIRTIRRMIEDGRLTAKKVYMPYGKYIWIIDLMAIARIQVRGELKREAKQAKKSNPVIYKEEK